MGDWAKHTVFRGGLIVLQEATFFMACHFSQFRSVADGGGCSPVAAAQIAGLVARGSYLLFRISYFVSGVGFSCKIRHWWYHKLDGEKTEQKQRGR